MALPPAASPSMQALAHIAAMASNKVGVPIISVAQRDLDFCWGAAAVHPMQALETHYQGIVRTAERAGGDPIQQRNRASAALLGCYFFEATQVRLLGVERDRPYRGWRYPLPSDALRHAQAEVRAAADIIAAPGADPTIVPTRIADARAATWRVCELFMPPASLAPTAQAITNAANQITQLAPAQTVVTNLKAALRTLDAAVAGVASVQMFYIIEPFYLSRLLVSYRVRSDTEVSEEDAMLASGALTGILNQQQWVIDWLAHAMIDLELAIGEVDPNNHTRFFLKGGRALAYLGGQPQTGRNDWDTQVLIDPDLPPAAWYALYREVSNAILLTLVRKKDEFLSLLAANANAILALPMPPPDPPDPYAEDAPDPPWANIDDVPVAPPSYEAGFTRACKAEMIDVGMPRRDTIELREQWTNLSNDIIRPIDGMPIPGYAYYIAEYITMIREFFAGASPSPGKARKRIERLAELLADPASAIAIVAAMQQIPQPIWTEAGQPIAAFAGAQLAPARQPLQYALIVLLDQFAIAHNMGAEPQLADLFARYFVEWMVDEEVLAGYPPNFRFTLSTNAEGMADAIGFGHWIAERLTAHDLGRAALIAAHRVEIEALIRAVYEASIFDQRSEYEVQLAIGGSLGAQLHAEYQNMPLLKGEPISTVTIGIYYEGGGINAATAIELVVQLVRNYLAQQPVPLFVLDETQPGVLKLFWAEPQTIEPFGHYCPLAIEIVAKRVRERPLLSFIWGLPVLGLRDLIVEYQQRAAHIDEFTVRGQLRETAAALTDMLMVGRT